MTKKAPNQSRTVIADNLYLGDGAVYPADPKVSGINANLAIVGGTGTGKTFSCVLPLLLHNTDQSMVVPVSKREIIDQTSSTLKRHGYKVEIIDFAKGRSTIGFNPLKYIHDDMDAQTFAKNLIGTICKSDPYWDITAINLISALVLLEVIIAEQYGQVPSLDQFLEYYKQFNTSVIRMGRNNGMIAAPLPEELEDLNYKFQALEEDIGSNSASSIWRSLPFRSEKTISSILSTVNVGMSQFTEGVIKSAGMKHTIDFEKLGQEKTVLFVVTSPFDIEGSRYVNIFYSMMLKELMASASRSANDRLEIPVQIVFDDFACGTQVTNFDRYISIFRAAGISTVLLLQSESQLVDIYGKPGATTILNNCDTYVYMGGNDLQTCYEVSRRCNKDVTSILNMELNNVIIFRRGAEPVFTERYPILRDKSFINNENERSA